MGCGVGVNVGDDKVDLIGMDVFDPLTEFANGDEPVSEGAHAEKRIAQNIIAAHFLSQLVLIGSSKIL
jgi:hypothetical protein